MRTRTSRLLSVSFFSGNLVAPDVILSNIGGIMRDQDCTAQFPVGVLTTENRDVWADARKHLESLGNSEVLDLIDSSLFNLCLDEVRLGNDRIKTVEQFLHSNGVNRFEIVIVLHDFKCLLDSCWVNSCYY